LSNSFRLGRNCKILRVPVENFDVKFANMAVSQHPNVHLVTYITHKVKTCRGIVNLSVATRRGRKGDIVLLNFLRAFQLSICSLDSNLLFEKMGKPTE
jgi:hypothetical protein